MLNVGNRSWTTSGSKLAGIFVRYSNFGRKIGQYSELLDAMKVSILLLNNGTWNGFLLKPMLIACSFHKIWFRIIKYIQMKKSMNALRPNNLCLTLILKSKMLTRTMYCQNTKYLLISYLRKRSKFRTHYHKYAILVTDPNRCFILLNPLTRLGLFVGTFSWLRGQL